MHGVLRVVLRRQVPEGRLDDVSSSNLQRNSRVSEVAVASTKDICWYKRNDEASRPIPSPLMNV